MMQAQNPLTRLYTCLKGLVLGLSCFLLILPVVSAGAKTKNLLHQEYQKAIPVAEAVGRAMVVGAHKVKVKGVRPSGSLSLPARNPIVRKHELQFAGAYITAIEKSGKNPAQRRMTGAIMHCDSLTRALATRFQAVYLMLKDGTLVLEETQLDPIYPEHPRVALFFVPAEKVNLTRFKSYGGVEQLNYVIKRAVTVEGPKKTSNELRKYYVFAFVMERLTENTRLELAIGQSASGTAGFKTKTVHWQDDGWHMAYAPARFALDGDSELFFKILKRSPQQAQPSLLIVFSSFSLVKRIQIALQNRGYSPGPSNGILTPQTRQAIQKFQRKNQLEVDGAPSLALLQILTSSTRISPVKMTQQHLTDLGYRPGPVDGLMGRKTRSAIRAFQKDMGLKNSGKLPAELFSFLMATQSTATVQAATPRTTPKRVSGAKRSKFEAYRSKYWVNEAK